MTATAIKTKRVRFKYDKPASEKQVSYLNTLLAGMKAKADQAIGAQNDQQRALVTGFWALARLPETLTSWEASGLISAMQSPGTEWTVIRSAMGAVQLRSSGQPLNDSNTRLALLALTDSVAYLVESAKK